MKTDEFSLDLTSAAGDDFGASMDTDSTEPGNMSAAIQVQQISTYMKYIVKHNQLYTYQYN